MQKILLASFVALLSTQVFAQKEAQEYPWEKTARTIAVDEAKIAARKKTEQQRKTESKKPEKKNDVENNKGK